jgi:DNA-binding beta-propeller fold protein YncE
MRRRWIVLVAALAVLAAVLAGAMSAGRATTMGPRPVALITAETENEVLVVSLPDGAVVRRLRLPQGPQTVAAAPGGPAVVVSPRAGTVALVGPSFTAPDVLRGFRSPQLAAITPDGRWSYVTEGARGTLSVIALGRQKVVRRVSVGLGAHHLAISPDGRRTWVALGEHATTVVILDTSRPDRPRVLARLTPPGTAHDLAFAPGGRTVWVTSATSPDVAVIRVHSGRVVARIPAGPPPQHVVFGPGTAYLTSGNAGTVEAVDPHTYAVLARARVPIGSYNLAVAGDLLVTTSLSNGAVTELTAPGLHRRFSRALAPATREVAIIRR